MWDLGWANASSHGLNRVYKCVCMCVCVCACTRAHTHTHTHTLSGQVKSQSFVCVELWCPIWSCLWSPWCGAFRGESIDVDRGPMWLTVFHTHWWHRQTDRDLPWYLAKTLPESATNGIHLQTVANTHHRIQWAIFGHHSRIKMHLCIVSFPDLL